MRVKAKDALAAQRGRACLDRAGGGVAVFHRRRKITFLERTAHRLVFARRYAAQEDETLGAAADGAGGGADQHFLGGGRGQSRFTNLAAAGRDEPESAPSLAHLGALILEAEDALEEGVGPK